MPSAKMKASDGGSFGPVENSAVNPETPASTASAASVAGLHLPPSRSDRRVKTLAVCGESRTVTFTAASVSAGPRWRKLVHAGVRLPFRVMFAMFPIRPVASFARVKGRVYEASGRPIGRKRDT